MGPLLSIIQTAAAAGPGLPGPGAAARGPTPSRGPTRATPVPCFLPPGQVLHRRHRGRRGDLHRVPGPRGGVRGAARRGAPHDTSALSGRCWTWGGWGARYRLKPAVDLCVLAISKLEGYHAGASCPFPEMEPPSPEALDGPRVSANRDGRTGWRPPAGYQEVS